MKINVPSIPEEGKNIPIHPGLAWVRTLVAERFKDFCPPESGMSGDVMLFRTHTNVTLQGQVHLEIQPTCDRCGKVFQNAWDIPLHRHLAPYFDNPDERREAGEEEIELEAEDLDFSCYHNEEIDLAQIIAEEVILALPMGFHCREDCQGLCPRCGADLNEEKCRCPKEKEGSPFAALKSLKLPPKAP
jgi:uncharacterized protein